VFVRDDFTYKTALAASGSLFNAMIGEGMASSPSHRSMLYVDVRGRAELAGTAHVQAWIRGASRPFSDQTFDLKEYFVEGSEHKFRLPVVLTNPVGEALVVRAWVDNIGGQSVKSPVVERTTLFGFGE
jgi:hypothetical protein